MFKKSRKGKVFSLEKFLQVMYREDLREREDFFIKEENNKKKGGDKEECREEYRDKVEDKERQEPVDDLGDIEDFLS